MKIIDFRHELLPLKDKMFRLALRITLNRAEQREANRYYGFTAQQTLDLVQTDAFDSAPRPDEDMEQQESLKRVREIMSGLPEAQRTALQLREIEGHSYRETADIMNVSEANVKVLIFRARQAVKNQIDKIENYGL